MQVPTDSTCNLEIGRRWDRSARQSFLTAASRSHARSRCHEPNVVEIFLPLQDAASLCVAILSAKTRGRTFMGTDNHPLTRRVDDRRIDVPYRFSSMQVHRHAGSSQYRFIASAVGAALLGDPWWTTATVAHTLVAVTICLAVCSPPLLMAAPPLCTDEHATTVPMQQAQEVSTFLQVFQQCSVVLYCTAAWCSAPGTGVCMDLRFHIMNSSAA